MTGFSISSGALELLSSVNLTTYIHRQISLFHLQLISCCTLTQEVVEPAGRAVQNLHQQNTPRGQHHQLIGGETALPILRKSSAQMAEEARPQLQAWHVARA